MRRTPGPCRIRHVLRRRSREPRARPAGHPPIRLQGAPHRPPHESLRQIGTAGTRVIEVYPSANTELIYRSLVERNGVPVGAEERAEQYRAYRRQVTDVEQRAIGARRRRAAAARRDAAARERTSAMIDDVVDTLLFKIEGRVIHNGEEAITIAFAPKPEARPKTRQGRLVQTFIGTMWVREADAEVMHLEAHAVDNISFGLGIVARLNKGRPPR